LGSVHSKAEHLLHLLKHVRCERLYLVGDIVDMWAMHRRVYWPEPHNAVLQEFLKKSKTGAEVIYIPGNHDMTFREFCDSEFGNIKIRKEGVHRTADGLRLLVTHGDELDYAVRYSGLNRVIGDFAYDLLMTVNRVLNKWRERMGKPYWSLAGWVKSHVTQAEQAVHAYQRAEVHLARDKGYDGIVCGHLHHPVIERHDDILYCNDGDWVENCSALLEDGDGQLHLIKAVGSESNAREMMIAVA
jgi:UDP-2,3-diacylglucosamine pyrophosphatase LpxH